MSIITDLRARRDALKAEGLKIVEAAGVEQRRLSESEEVRVGELIPEIQKYDERIQQLADADHRADQTDAAFARLEAQPVTRASYPGQLSPQDADTDAAFRSAIRSRNPAPIEIPVSTRSYYQPGVEQRDLLKTTATQALRVNVWDQIVQHMVENSAVLKAGATLVTTPTGEDLQVPKSTGFSTAAQFAEAASITESDPTLAVVTLKAWKFATFFQVSHELANDSGTDLLGFLARQAGEALALAYGDKLINGVGTTEPRGVLADTTAGVSGVTGTGTTLGTQGTANQGTDILYGLHGSLAEPYANSSSRAWVLRNASLTTVRKLKDTAGQPVVGNDGNSFLGAPFVVDPFVPAMANLAKSIIYGDWSRFFVRIAEGVRFERSNDFAFGNDLVSFRAVTRIDSALTDNNAIKHFANAT